MRNKDWVWYEDSFPPKKNIDDFSSKCLVYLIHNSKEVYIGQTSNLSGRLDNTHHSVEYFTGKKPNKSLILSSNFFNKSAVYDIETRMISYIDADTKMTVVNKNFHQKSHDYFDKNKTDIIFDEVWKSLKKDKKIINESQLDILINSAMYKLSPFKSLGLQQLEVLDKAISHISDQSSKSIKISRQKSKTLIIEGAAGTGKTLVAIRMIFELFKENALKDKKIAICCTQPPIRKVLKSRLKAIGIGSNLAEVINPKKLLNHQYDLVIIDEAHRLRQWNGGQKRFLKDYLKEGETELMLARKKSKHLILFYDKEQNVLPVDIGKLEKSLGSEKPKFLRLEAQYRVMGAGENSNYIRFIKSLLQISNTEPKREDLGKYDIKIFNSLKELHKEISEKEKVYKLCRLGAGYYVKWHKNSAEIFDFKEAEGCDFNWNEPGEGWAEKSHVLKNQIGSIHTLQGVDLNYAGIILGDEIYLDPNDKRIKVRKENYYDQMGKAFKGVDKSPDELSDLIKNIYYVLLTRGIRGTYLYIKDENLRNYIAKCCGLS